MRVRSILFSFRRIFFTVFTTRYEPTAYNRLFDCKTPVFQQQRNKIQTYVLELLQNRKKCQPLFEFTIDESVL